MAKQQTQIWNEYWRRENQAPDKDDAMCLFLAEAIGNTFTSLTGRRAQSAIEMGAGSGRTSRYLNEQGAQTGIFDLSEEALKLAEHANQGLKNEVRYICADLFKFTPEQVGRQYELVWNAGVLEHFTSLEKRVMLTKMSTVLSDGGLMLILCPYANSIFYRMGKKFLETIGKFPYGAETPVRRLAPDLPDSLELVTPEKSVGFLILIFNAFKLLLNFPALQKVGVAVHRASTIFFVGLLRNPGTRRMLFALDAILSRLFGGYLLMTVCRRKVT